MSDTPVRRKCSWVSGGILVVGFTSIAPLGRFLWGAFEKVISGHGLDTYRTVWLVEFNFIGVIVLFGAVVLALIFAGGLWFHEWWQIRSLEKKYGPRSGNT